MFAIKINHPQAQVEKGSSHQVVFSEPNLDDPGNCQKKFWENALRLCVLAAIGF